MRWVKSQERKVESQSRSFPRSAWECTVLTLRVDGTDPFRIPHSAFRYRSAVTLIELLITIMIISILAAMILGAAAVAGNAAREAKTRNIVARLHTLLAEQADSYKTRRVRVRSQVEDAINSYALYSGSDRGRALATARLFALREMMLMEMPDRWSDIWLEDISPPTLQHYPIYLADPPELWLLYKRRLDQLTNITNSITGSPNTPCDLRENQGAECLYMVITLACGDGEARSQFHESDIGDTDGDGAPEFLDGWGHPIGFLRWAPGFNSDIQSNANLLGSPPPLTGTNTWLATANGDHDPYDMYRVDPAAFRLVPLIYSAGRDEEYGLFVADEAPSWIGILDITATFNPASMTASFPFAPYQELTDNTVPLVTAYLGTDDDTGTATDNVHNHLIGGR